VQQKRKPGNRADVRGPLANAVGRVRHIRYDHADRRVENVGTVVHGLHPECHRPLCATAVARYAKSVLRAAAATDGPVQHPGSEHRRQRRHRAHRQLTRRSKQPDVSSVAGPVAHVIRHAAAAANVR